MVKVWRKPLTSTNNPIDEHPTGIGIDTKDDGHLFVLKPGAEVVAIYAPGEWLRATSER